MSPTESTATKSRLIRIGADPAGKPCLNCGRSDGEIFLFRCQFSPTWGDYPLHEACVGEWEDKRLDWQVERLREQNQYRLDCEAYQRGGRAKPELPPHMKADEIRRRAWEANHPGPNGSGKTNGSGGNVVNFKRETEDERYERIHREQKASFEKEQAQRRQELTDIQRETGLDRERATWLYYFRHNTHLPEHQEIFCQTFEQKLAAATADRLLSGGNGYIDWDALDRKRSGDSSTARQFEHRTRQSERALSPIPLTFFTDLSDTPAWRPWLIKNVMARDETSSWIAPPGKGKSALLTDIAVHVAAGNDWRGHRVKEHCGVVYFALERADLVRRRLTAYKLRDSLGSLPIAVAGQMIDLLDRRCVDQILAAIREAEQRFDCAAGLVIFDTYAKGIAAGGGDEDKAKDQNIVQANLRRLFDRGCHVHIAGVGHTGKDESKGERGSNARLADVDLLVQITGDAVKTVTVKKGNDQPEGVLTGFQLEPFDFGPDEDGEPFRTFIVGTEVYDAAVGDSRQRPSDKQMLALRALADVTLSHGREPPPTFDLPPDIKVVAADQWREELYRRNVLDRDARNPRARFKELRNALAIRSLIGDLDDTVWLIRPPVQP